MTGQQSWTAVPRRRSREFWSRRQGKSFPRFVQANLFQNRSERRAAVEHLEQKPACAQLMFAPKAFGAEDLLTTRPETNSKPLPRSPAIRLAMARTHWCLATRPGWKRAC